MATRENRFAKKARDFAEDLSNTGTAPESLSKPAEPSPVKDEQSKRKTKSPASRAPVSRSLGSTPSKKLIVKKSTPGRPLSEIDTVQFSTRLRPDQIKSLKLFVVENDHLPEYGNISAVIRIAVDDFLKTH